MQDLGTFPAVLDGLNFKFSLGSMPPDLSSLFMLYHSVHLKGRLQTRLQTNCQSIHLYITSPYWWESKSVSKGFGEWENREVMIDLAKNIMATPLKVRCKRSVAQLSWSQEKFTALHKIYLNIWAHNYWMHLRPSLIIRGIKDYFLIKVGEPCFIIKNKSTLTCEGCCINMASCITRADRRPSLFACFR